MKLRPFWHLIDSCAEKQGVVVDIKRDASHGELSYTVRFGSSGHGTDRDYFEAELEFLT